MKNKIIRVVLIVISCFLILLTFYVKKNFNSATFEQLFYSLYTSKGASNSSIYEGIIFISVGLILFLSFIKVLAIFYKKIIEIKKLNKFILTDKRKTILTIIFLLSSVFFMCYKFGLIKYIINQSQVSTIFEDYYIDPKNVEISFPDKKQNLIYIFVESLENTNFSKENGGLNTTSYIPNLEKLSSKNINFSNSEKLGGAIQIYGSNFTVAAMVSQTSGTPFKVSFNKNFYNSKNNLLPGVYSIGEILEENGYKNYLMLGSLASFGNRSDYFIKNGNYEIIDYKYAIENNLIPDDYNVWWGYEDSKLYKFAKEKLLEISKNSEPFNLTILTADTHFVDGYIDKECDEIFENHYANSFYCTDKMLNDFINFVKEQDFYKDTTIVIVGDHLTMQENFYNDLDENYDRTIYNTIINSRVSNKNNKNRLYSSFDYFPTTLAALGCEIENNKLGFGTNLFSDEKTLIEELSLKKVNKELEKRSIYYENNILTFD